jgi:hypothetical protein
VEVFLGPLSKALGSNTNIFWWYKLFFIENCAPFIFLRNWVLVVPYLCFTFRIFYRPVLEKYVFQVEGGPHLFQSCLHLMRNDLPLALREMHISF